MSFVFCYLLMLSMDTSLLFWKSRSICISGQAAEHSSWGLCFFVNRQNSVLQDCKNSHAGPDTGWWILGRGEKRILSSPRCVFHSFLPLFSLRYSPLDFSLPDHCSPLLPKIYKPRASIFQCEMNEVLHDLMLTLHLIMKEARNIVLENNMNKQGEGGRIKESRGSWWRERAITCFSFKW